MTTTTPQVDVNVPRFNQALVAILTGIAFLAQWWPLVGLVAVVLAATRFLGPRYGLFTQTYLRLVRPGLDGPSETEWTAPPRFAQLLGVIFLGAASALFVLGFGVAGWALTLMVTALAALAATTRICVGCMIYEWFATP
jgi:hypothetical protein